MVGSRSGNFWLAIFSLVGTTIGAGIFGLPYVFSYSGFFIGLVELAILAGLILIIQLMVGEIALRTEGRKRLLGYADLYLSRIWRRALTASIVLASVGSLLAYLILAGKFISLLTGLSEFISVILFFLIWFFMILSKSKLFGKAELYLGIASITLVIFIAIFNLGHINIDNLKTFNPQNALLPYGIILFAITGASVVPEMEELLAGSKNKLKWAIILGTLIPTAAYLLFIITVVGISGSMTSSDAVSGLARALNSRFILPLGAIVGLITVSQAALSYGVYFKETLWYDLKINKRLAWILAGALPFMFYILGARGFVGITSVIGAVFLGFQLIMILRMHRVAKSSEVKPVYEIKLPRNAYWFFAALLILGALLEIRRIVF